MNHWFLVGRDIMWFCVGGFPLVIMGLGVAKEESEGAMFATMAVMFQWLLIACLYYEVIK